MPRKELFDSKRVEIRNSRRMISKLITAIVTPAMVIRFLVDLGKCIVIE